MGKKSAPADGCAKLAKGLFWRGSVIWARFKIKGVEYRISCHTSSARVAQERREKERQALIDQHRYGKPGKYTWSDAVIEWTKSPPAKLSLKTIARYSTSLLQLESYFERTLLREIDEVFLNGVVNKRLENVSARTVQRDLTAISSVLRVAYKKGWIKANPARTMDRKDLWTSRHKIVLPVKKQVNDVIAECPAVLGSLAELAWETGVRQNEAVRIEHENIDLKKAQATIYFGAKRDKVRTIDLTARAVEIIKAQPVHSVSPKVFWTGEGEALKNVSSRFAAIVRRVEASAKKARRQFRKFRFHDLRHDFAVRYLKEGRGSIYDLQLLLGHDSIKTTEGYPAYLTPEEQRAAKHGK